MSGGGGGVQTHFGKEHQRVPSVKKALESWSEVGIRLVANLRKLINNNKLWCLYASVHTLSAGM